jgi:LacI family transcriptional regulator
VLDSLDNICYNVNVSGNDHIGNEPEWSVIGSRRVTIREVAEQAGVSTQTVSRVLNHRPDVAPETRRRVQEIIDRLGYQASNIARSLVQGRSFTLGVVAWGLEYFGPSRALSGIEQGASELGYVLLLSLMRQPGNSDVGQLLRDMLARQVDGIVWAVPEIDSNRDWIREQHSRLPVPVVFLSMRPQPDLSIAAVDNRSGGRMATKHLLDVGYENVGLITGPLTWWEARQRQSGWQDALQEAGIATEDNLVVEGDWQAASGERGLHQLLEQRPDLDAVFISNDQMALGALQAARKLGVRVPEDLALVGFDDVPESVYFLPPLSTVRQDMLELGRCAVRELGGMIEATQQGEADVEPNTILLEPELIVRESSGFPKPKGQVVEEAGKKRDSTYGMRWLV